MNRSIRVLIAESNVNFAQILQDFLDGQDGVKVVGVVRDGQGVVSSCKDFLPDVVLLDLHLPVLDSIKAIQAVLAQNERIKILGLSSGPNDRYAIEAIKMGASGCIHKDGDNIVPQAMFEALQQVARGEVWLSPHLASSILREFHRLSE